MKQKPQMPKTIQALGLDGCNYLLTRRSISRVLRRWTQIRRDQLLMERRIAALQAFISLSTNPRVKSN